MTNADFIEIIGYFFLSFTTGFTTGFLMKVFFRSIGLVR